MTNVVIEYSNYNPLYKEFPLIISCKKYSNKNIINLHVLCNNDIIEVYDDLGFDTNGQHHYVTFGYWYHTVTGKKYGGGSYDEYSYISCTIKLYSKEYYSVCYSKCLNNELKLSFITKSMLNIEENYDKIY